eukprot:jgi/Orpsp1_1/1188037/evm.model.d7180000062036.1
MSRDDIVFDTIEDAIEAIKNGKMVIVVDNEDRENEGDFIMAAEDCTPEQMGFIIRYSGGVVCCPTTEERLNELGLPIMVEKGSDNMGTAFTITTDFAHGGVTTGISGKDRSTTVKAIANPKYKSSDFNKPGHVFPLIARKGGVLKRIGHTEAAVDLCVLAGKYPAGVISEVMHDDGTMARRNDLRIFSNEHNIKLITISSLVEYRKKLGKESLY